MENSLERSKSSLEEQEREMLENNMLVSQVFLVPTVPIPRNIRIKNASRRDEDLLCSVLSLIYEIANRSLEQSLRLIKPTTAMSGQSNKGGTDVKI